MKDKVLISFAGGLNSYYGIQPKEFSSFLNKNFKDIDTFYFSDTDMNLYQSGMDVWDDNIKQWKRISNTIEDSAEYVRSIIKNYSKVYFIGNSIGAYIGIICASIIKDRNINMLVYVPQLKILNLFPENHEAPLDRSKFNSKYSDISDMNIDNINLFVNLDISMRGSEALHSIDHAKWLYNRNNVQIIEHKKINMKEYRDSERLLKDFKNFLI